MGKISAPTPRRPWRKWQRRPGMMFLHNSPPSAHEITMLPHVWRIGLWIQLIVHVSALVLEASLRRDAKIGVMQRGMEYQGHDVWDRQQTTVDCGLQAVPVMASHTQHFPRPRWCEFLPPCVLNGSGRIDAMVKENKVMLFMKGNKLFPQCGFSNTAVQILRACDVDFETFDVLSDPDIRQGIKKYSNWPTIPQLFISGEFTGGCDIMVESFQSGELKKMLEEQGAKFME
ncbi:unnamed protein product [Discosporangium mesarthrocarpum]